MTEPLYLSPSSIDRLGRCEQHWILRKLDDSDTRMSRPDYFILGSAWGRMKAAWWSRRDWVPELLQVAREDGWEPGFELPRVYRKAAWMMARWITVYGDDPPHPVIGTEVPYDLLLFPERRRPYRPEVRGHGFLDILYRRGQGRFDPTWLDEEKTMGRWGRDSMIDFDPQLGMYLWAGRQMFKVEGATFSCASTYEYKGDDPGESFRLFDRTWEQMEHNVARVIEDADRAATRMYALMRNPDLAIRTIKPECTRCQDFRPCLLGEES